MIKHKVLDTFSAKKGQSGLPRPKVDILELILDFGIKDDKFAGKDIDKAVMIVGKTTYDLAKENDISIEYGSLGENILFDFNPHDYHLGTIFEIGEAQIQITENCTICNHLAVFDDDLPIIVQGCRGIYCKILKSGEVKKGSTVKIIEKQHNVA